MFVGTWLFDLYYYLYSTIPLDFPYNLCYLLLLSVCSSQAARLIFPEKFSARPYITLGYSTRQRGNQHSGRVHSSLLRYIPLMLPNSQSFPVRYACHDFGQNVCFSNVFKTIKLNLKVN